MSHVLVRTRLPVFRLLIGQEVLNKFVSSCRVTILITQQQKLAILIEDKKVVKNKIQTFYVQKEALKKQKQEPRFICFIKLITKIVEFEGN